MPSEATAEAAVAVSRQCITCDNCKAPGPQKCCSRCSHSYYCSKFCQTTHWKTHKRACNFMKSHREMFEKDRLAAVPDEAADVVIECAVCLEDVTKPVTLDCGHTFCFGCLGEMEQKELDCCPMCRGELPDMAERSLKRADMYHGRAVAQSAIRSAEKKKYGELALAEYDAIESLPVDSEKEVPLGSNPTLLIRKAKVSLMAERPEVTVETANKIMKANTECPDKGLALDRNDIFLVTVWKAQAYLALEKWKDARRLFMALYADKVRLASPLAGYGAMTFHGPVLKGITRSEYELGNYKAAIKYGTRAIKLWRHTPEAHKYVALAQKAKGDITAAKNTISRAILYEYSWDKENLQANVAVLKELE